MISGSWWTSALVSVFVCVWVFFKIVDENKGWLKSLLKSAVSQLMHGLEGLGVLF